MKETTAIQWGGCSIAAIFTATQTQQIFQLISLILTCVATLLTIMYTLYKWYKAAKKDGKITKEEIEEGIDIVMKGAEELSKEIDKANKGDKE